VVLWERTLPLLKFGVNGIVLGPGKPITLQAPREDVEVDMRHGLPRCGTVLRRPISFIRHQWGGKGMRTIMKRCGVVCVYSGTARHCT
jgi:hypothetical protein